MVVYLYRGRSKGLTKFCCSLNFGLRKDPLIQTDVLILSGYDFAEGKVDLLLTQAIELNLRQP